ncbi:MAG: DEAD/DEAH box helicase [Flavobacteriaceae bacterium]|nr:DEAD/DEAH box helicase [Flavobacteriaceae bacterium]
MEYNHFTLGIDLAFDATLQNYLPTAYIVENKNSRLGYIQKKATLETLPGYQIVLTENERAIFDLIQTVQIDNIAHRFNATKKSKKTLDELLKVEDHKRVILPFVERQLAKFYDKIIENPLPISIEMGRAGYFNQHQIQIAKEPAIPKLFFSKDEMGLTYSLQLDISSRIINPSETKVTLLLNTPGWIVVDGVLYALEHINAKKLSPFLTKKTLIIPQKTAKAYFESFIKDVVKKVDIVAEGFQVISQNALQTCIIEPVYHLFSGKYIWQLRFVYGEIEFISTDFRKKHVSLLWNDSESISILETKRDFEQENVYYEKLKAFNFVYLEEGFFSNHSDLHQIEKYELVYNLLTLKSQLEEAGFQVSDFEIDRNVVYANGGNIQHQISDKMDWFDIEMTIKTGAFEFPFTQIVSNLKTGNRFYELPNATFFLIPDEWFSQYKPLLDWADIQSNQIKIRKSQFTLLEVLQTDKPKPLLQTQETTVFQTPTTIKATLRPYQETGVNWLWEHHQNHLGACLADDMGLGKSLQCITLLDHVRTTFPIIPNTEVPNLDLFTELSDSKAPLQSLIVCPTSLVYNWENEIQKFAPHFKVALYLGKDRKQLQKTIQSQDITITSYSVLLRDFEWFNTLHFLYLIVDESQQIKNRDSKIFKIISQIDAEHKVSLSGTPIENSLSDLWSQMQFINPNLLGEYPKFEKIFKKPIEKNQSEEALTHLKSLVKPYILRRTKEQVLTDLPKLTEQVFFSELEESQKLLYESEKSKARNLLLGVKTTSGKHNAQVFKTLMKLRQLSNHPWLAGEIRESESGKFSDVTLYLETLLKSGQKVLIYSFFVDHLKIYTQWCENQGIPFALFTGQTKVENRKNEIEKFRNDASIQLFFMTTQSGGVGLTLTEANFVLILDPWWNPFKELQATGRAHRIGQEKPVHVVRFIAKNTIEEKILNLQARKKGISDAIIELQTVPSEVLEQLEFILE